VIFGLLLFEGLVKDLFRPVGRGGNSVVVVVVVGAAVVVVVVGAAVVVVVVGAAVVVVVVGAAVVVVVVVGAAVVVVVGGAAVVVVGAIVVVGITGTTGIIETPALFHNAVADPSVFLFTRTFDTAIVSCLTRCVVEDASYPPV